MSEENSSSSTSESEIDACSSKFDPLKALYSKKTHIPVEKAPMYENLQQFEAAQKNDNIIPVGQKERFEKREKEKQRAKLEKEAELAEKNKQRFAQYEGLVQPKRKNSKNVLTRIGTTDGPLAALKDCVDQRLRIKVITRNAHCIRGELNATLIAFDKQWNLALTDVVEIWKRKVVTKRKIPAGLGKPVPKGSAAKISPVPLVMETLLSDGMLQCTRHVPQLLVRGEHVVLISIMER